MNGQVEGFDKTSVTPVRQDMDENQTDWDLFAQTITDGYNTQVHRATSTFFLISLLAEDPWEPLSERSCLLKKSVKLAFFRPNRGSLCNSFILDIEWTLSF